MATSSSGAVPASLTRVARLGRLGTKTLPQTGAALGAFSTATHAGQADGAASVMRELLSAESAAHPGGVPVDEVQSPLAAIFGDLAAPARAPAPASSAPPTPAPPAAADTRPHVAAGSESATCVPVGRRNRLQRFAPQFADGDPLPHASGAAPAAPSGGTVPGKPDASQESDALQQTSRLRKFIPEASRPDVVGVRKGMAAANVLAPLVASVSFYPGSDAGGQPRAQALSAMLVAVHRMAVDAAESLSRAMGEDVPSWMVTQLMGTLSREIADRWQRTGTVDIDAFAANLAQLLGSQAPEMATLISAASEDAYVAVNSPDVARYRIAVSVTKAAWTIHGWVTHERLSIDPAGDMPSHFYTYGLQTDEMVNKLLVRCVSECQSLVAQVDSADLRTAHMQASINRMANLMGAEYVTQTRRIMNWLGEESISDAEYGIRYNAARQQLDTRILPHVFEWARVHFVRIEQGAFRAIEDLHEKSTSPRPASADAGTDSPARQ